MSDGARPAVEAVGLRDALHRAAPGSVGIYETEARCRMIFAESASKNPGVTLDARRCAADLPTEPQLKNCGLQDARYNR